MVKISADVLREVELTEKYSHCEIAINWLRQEQEGEEKSIMHEKSSANLDQLSEK